MDIPTRREREDLERLEALYDATGGGRTEAAGPPAALEPLGVAHDDAYLWMCDASWRASLRLMKATSLRRSPAVLVVIWLSVPVNGERTVQPVAVERLPSCWRGRTAPAAM